MLVENNSKNTNISLETIKDITAPTAKHYTQTREQEEKVGFIKQRKTLMDNKRPDKYWKQYIKQYEAIFVPYADGRSASNVPLERAIIELFIAEAVKRKTNFSFDGAIGYKFQEQILEKVWKDDWSVNDRESEILDNEYITAMMGTSVIFTGYNREYRVFSDFDGEDDDGKIKFQKKLQNKSEILVKNIDIRNFWIDERATKVEEAIDCIYEEYITYEQFLDLKLNKQYNKDVLEAIVPTSSKSDSYRPFMVQEELGEGESKYVKITKYWNTKLDVYIEIANDSYIILEHPILNVTHSLPFVVRQYSKEPYSIYGKGLCELLAPFKSDINKLREMIMEAIKKSNQEVIAIGGGLSFDGNKFAFNNQFLKFKGNMQGNFQQLSGTPPNQAIFNRLQDLFREIAIFVGIDIMNILGEAQQTAYQTAVQKESSLQRINVVFKNRDKAFERLAMLHKDNLQMFYPLKMVRELVNLNDDNEEIEEVEKTYPTIEVPKMKNKKFLDTNEKQIFEITPETIRGDIRINVSTDLNAPTITEVEKEQRMQFFNSVQSVTAAYANDPELQKIIPKNKALKDLAKLNNIDTEEQMDVEASEEKAKLFNEVKDLMGGMRSPAVQEEETNLADVSPEGQVPEINNIRTPNI